MGGQFPCTPKKNKTNKYAHETTLHLLQTLDAQAALDSKSRDFCFVLSFWEGEILHKVTITTAKKHEVYCIP